MVCPNFFCTLNTLVEISQMEFTGNYRVIDDFTIDIIDYSKFIAFRDNCMEIFQRGMIYTHDTTDASNLGFVKNGLEFSDDLGEENKVAFKALFDACCNISKYIQDKQLVSVYSFLDAMKSGIVLYFEEDELKYKVVSGKERPALTCCDFMNDENLCRPYEDEDSEELDFNDYLNCASWGVKEAMAQVGAFYLSGYGVEKDPEKAIYWLEKAAESGMTMALFNLGLCYYKGYGVEKRDFEKAKYYMQLAADDGDTDAIFLVEKYEQICELYKNLDTSAQAQADYASILMLLATSLDVSDTTERDYKESYEYALKAAEQNNGDGLWVLALCYEHGRGVKKDTQEAIKCYEKGAELKHAKCEHSLACYYMRHEMPKDDDKLVFELCLDSANQGYDLAYASLGKCYQFGTGTDCDLDKAVEWYEKYLETHDDPELQMKVFLLKNMHF